MQFRYGFRPLCQGKTPFLVLVLNNAHTVFVIMQTQVEFILKNETLILSTHEHCLTFQGNARW